MSKKFMSKKKVGSAVAAGLTAAVIMLGGTFAWQSYNQEALNEVSATVNPGGRLHDDFNEITADDDYENMTFDKNVYAENFTSRANNGVQIYARVRLDEYMELGNGAGNETGNDAISLMPGAELAKKNTWTTYHYGEDSDFRDYWEMSFGGEATYMPTFNKDMNSLDADINGTFKNNFTDYTDYTLEANQEKTAMAIYADGQDANGDFVTKGIDETHTAAKTKNAFIISMADYLDALEAGTLDGNGFDGTGDFWVYDTDGWAYWANAIDPDTATGLLLDGINRTEKIINEDWYYAINVVAQFITYDDMGADNGTGFYDKEAGTVPTNEALKLLNTIGVKVNFNVSSEGELREAAAHGGTITLTEDITISGPIDVKADTVLNAGGHKITASADIYNEAEDVKAWSLLSVRNGATLTINDGEFAARENDSYCVDVRDGSKLVINGGTYKGNISAVYVLEGEAVIYGGNFSIQQLAEGNGYRFMLNCYDANYEAGTAKITVCGGNYTNFNPSEASEITIPGNYTVTAEADVYTVQKR